MWCDNVLLRSLSGERSPRNADDVVVVEGRAAVLRRYQDQGWRVLGLSWQPEVAEGSRSAADVHAVFARIEPLNEHASVATNLPPSKMLPPSQMLGGPP